MSTVLFSLGAWAYRSRRLVLTGWLLVMGIVGALALVVGTGADNTYEFPGTESQEALDSLGRTFPQFSGTSAQLIAVAPSGVDVTSSDFESAVNDTIDALGSIEQVSSVTSPYDGSSTGNIAPDDSAVLVPIQLTVDVPQVMTSTSEALQQQGRSLEQALPAGSTVAVGGQLFSQVEAGIGLSELASLGIALVVLLFTFGSLVAASMPLMTAVVGVGVAVSIVFTNTRFVTISSTAPLLTVMLGVAVGVDYGLFIVSRHRDQVRGGMRPEVSAPRAVATAGSAVVFAATTVVVALLGLSVARIPFLTVTGVAAALGVSFAALVSITLTPALLGFAGMRVLPGRHRTERPPATDVTENELPAAGGDATKERASSPAAANEPAAHGESRSFFLHWVRAVTRFPLATVLVVVVALAVVALPAKELRLALPDSGTLPEGSPGRDAYDLIADSFGPGYNGPLLLTASVIQSTDPVTLVDDLGADIATEPGVASVPLATPNQAGDTAVIQVIPDGAPDSEATQQLVEELRGQEQRYLDEYAVELAVTGYTAVGIDISARLSRAVVPFGILVVGLSIVLLMMVFRSVVVPIAAALGYALSIAATLGILSRVYIEGVAAGLLGVTQLGSVTSFAPIIIMGVLFGLAMDYEIFLVSRMGEDYAHHREPREAVERGFQASSRVVTPAALIMATVFVAFVPGGQASLQPIALGLTLGVLIDAFIVRMVLTPAVLALFGHRSWWLPAWLDRLLPNVDVEGQALSHQDELADWPDPDSTATLALAGVHTIGMDPDDAGLDAVVEAGDVLVIEGGDSDMRAAALFALTGRLPITDGRCKVTGLVLPSQASTVRSRSAVVDVQETDDPIRSLLDAALDKPAILAIAGADTITDSSTRTGIAQLLVEARAGADARSESITIVLGGASRAAVDDLVPAGTELHVASLDRQPQATRTAGPE